MGKHAMCNEVGAMNEGTQKYWQIGDALKNAQEKNNNKTNDTVSAITKWEKPCIIIPRNLWSMYSPSLKKHYEGEIVVSEKIDINNECENE